MCNVTSTSCKVCCISDTKNKCCQKSQHRNYVLQNTSYTSVETAVKHNTINLKSVFRSSVMHSSLSGRIDGVDVNCVQLKKVGNDLTMSCRTRNYQRRPTDLQCRLIRQEP